MKSLLCSALVIGLVITGCSGGSDNSRADTVATAAPTATVVETERPIPTNTVEPQPAETEAIPSPTSSRATAPAGDPTSTDVPAETPTVQPTSTVEPSPASTPTEVQIPTGEDLQGSLLALHDLPVGWTTWQRGEPDAEVDGPSICNVEPLGDEFERVALADIDFQRSELGPFLSQVAAEYASPDVAIAVMNRVRSELTCTEWIDTNDLGEATVWTISPLSFPVTGEETFVIRMSANVGVAILEADLVYLRVAKVVTAIGHYAINSVDSELTISFAEAAAQKILRR